MEVYPKFVNSIRLDEMPKAVEFGKDIKLKSKLAQLQPLFESPLSIAILVVVVLYTDSDTMSKCTSAWFWYQVRLSSTDTWQLYLPPSDYPRMSCTACP